MKKDFITVTPDSGGSGITTVTVEASENQTASERSVNLSVAGGGMTRTVSLSQSEFVVDWNYYFSVTPTSLSFVADGESKSVTVTSYRKKVINGIETSTQENVNYTVAVTGTGFSGSGKTVTAAENSATSSRSGTATYTQTTSGKSQGVSLSQAAAVVTWNYYFSIAPYMWKFGAEGGTKSISVSSYRKKVLNGTETSTQENVTWTATVVDGEGFSINTDGTAVTATPNQSIRRYGKVRYEQETSGKFEVLQLDQDASTPVSIYIRLDDPYSQESDWEWEDLSTNQSGQGKFDSPVVIQDILGLSIQPNCVDCWITMIMGTSGGSDYVKGVSGDFEGVEFTRFKWDERDVEKRGEIEVSGKIIPLKIAVRL